MKPQGIKKKKSVGALVSPEKYFEGPYRVHPILRSHLFRFFPQITV